MVGFLDIIQDAICAISGTIKFVDLILLAIIK